VPTKYAERTDCQNSSGCAKLQRHGIHHRCAHSFSNNDPNRKSDDDANELPDKLSNVFAVNVTNWLTDELADT
jgi:hypothetical protein